MTLSSLDQTNASVADSPESDNNTLSALIRFFSLKFGSWIYIVVFSKIKSGPDLCIDFAFIVINPFADDSRNHILLSIKRRWSDVMLLELIFTEYGFIIVDATTPIKNAPIKNGRVD